MDDDMRAEHDQIPEIALNWHLAGKGAVIATVVQTWGSAPRRTGSQLAVSGASEIMGSVSGGCVEGAVVAEALEAIEDGNCRVLEFGVSSEDAFAVGLACGGTIRVMVEPVGVGRGISQEMLSQIVDARAARRPIAVETDTESWERRLLGYDDLPKAFNADRSGFGEETSRFVWLSNPPLRLAIVGAVHIAQPLAQMARLTGYDATVIDPREAFASEARFPGEKLVHDWPDEALANHGLDHRTAVVTLTHDPKLDDPALQTALRAPVFYIGALGSTRTHAKRVDRLRQVGFSAEEIGRIDAPIGLDIGAATPAEIAVAVLAELTERLRRPATRLGVSEPGACRVKFGNIPAAEAEGAILAHSLRLPDGVLKKGRVLSAADIDRLVQADIDHVVAAQPGPDDLPEDTAAGRIATALAPDANALGVTVAAPFTGRVNIFARTDGVFEVDRDAIDALNRTDEAITLATLDNHARVKARQMLATVKIIPYAAPDDAVRRVESLLHNRAALRVHPVRVRSADLILTRTPGMKDTVLRKGAEVVKNRLAGLGILDVRETVVAHEERALTDSLGSARSDLLLILTGSATSDRSDIGPAALEGAGGSLTRFGMPVDPGNLLFLGQLGARSVIGLPGCARSPKLNGADWVLERVACGIEVASDDIAGMGVGGLLKEIPSRPEPRAGGAEAPRKPVVATIILAAGAGVRMRGRDKLLEVIDDEPLLRRVARELGRSAIDQIVCVLRPADPDRRVALSGLDLTVIENPIAAEGMGTSLAAGVAALDDTIDAVLIAMGDMPEIGAGDVDRLLAAFDPGENRAIIRAVSADGRPGHPVLFGRRFFESLQGLSGDAGARSVIAENPDYVVDVQLPGQAAVTDLDTPEDWSEWRARA